MVPFNLKVLAKFGLSSNCSQKLHECSLARARKIFATVCMLGKNSIPCRGSIICILETEFTLEKMFLVLHNWEMLGKHTRYMIFSGNMLPRLVDVLLKLTRVKEFFAKGTCKGRK